jgi:hypothetical protein
MRRPWLLTHELVELFSFRSHLAEGFFMTHFAAKS